MRKHFEWVGDEELWLQMDNAGGHGADAMKIRMEEMMKKDFNITIEWQPAQSPDLNALDLGVWMSMQTAVAELGEGQWESPEAVWVSCDAAWNEWANPVSEGDWKPTALNKVWDKLDVIASEVIRMKGGNDHDFARGAGARVEKEGSDDDESDGEDSRNYDTGSDNESLPEEDSDSEGEL